MSDIYQRTEVINGKRKRVIVYTRKQAEFEFQRRYGSDARTSEHTHRAESGRPYWVELTSGDILPAYELGRSKS
jgi:hypothetical protein